MFASPLDMWGMVWYRRLLRMERFDSAEVLCWRSGTGRRSTQWLTIPTAGLGNGWLSHTRREPGETRRSPGEMRDL